MQYMISFLEGIITFISPCLLPMLPIYISYFAGGGSEKAKICGIYASLCSVKKVDFQNTEKIQPE